MKVRGKLLTSFAAIIVLNAILGAIVYQNFAVVKGNLDQIVEKHAPAANAITDLRLSLAEMVACQGTLLEGKVVYREVLASGKSAEEASRRAEPYYEMARNCAELKYAEVKESHEDFNAVGYFTGMEFEDVNAKIKVYNETFDYVRALERDFRAADWKKGDATSQLLSASAGTTDLAMQQIEQAIDEKLLEVNELTKQTSERSAQIIIAFNIAALILGIGLAMGLANVIAAPLRRLTAAANEIGEGNVDAEMPEIKSKDEVRDLADAIETLRSAIRFLKDRQK